MRKEHTVSEVTDAEGLTDAQFFYGEIKRLQSECDKLKLLNNKLLEENHKLEDKLGDARDTIRATYDIVRNAKSFLSATANKKLTKVDIINNIEAELKTLDITRKELERW